MGIVMATVEKMPMLQEGYDTLSRDLKRLKVERPQIVDAIEEARAHGDLSENAKAGRISYSSPLGRALIGRKVEDEVEVTVPSGDRWYVVSKVAFI